MKKNNIVDPKTVLPGEVSENDLLESAEMLRACMTLLRVSSGIFFFAYSQASIEKFGDKDFLTELGKHIDAVNSALVDAYQGYLSKAKHLHETHS